MNVASNWLQQSLARLQEDRFKLQTNLDHQGAPLLATAHRSRFELTKFGNCEVFFVFRNCHASHEAIQIATEDSFKYALSHKSCPLPRGFFEAVFAFSVCVVESLDQVTAQAVQTVTPRMRWAAAQIPVVYDASTNQLCYFQKTPIWGAAFYKGFRRQIEQYLATGGVQ